MCSQAAEHKFSGKWFRWAVGFLLAGVVAAAGLSADNLVVIREIKKDLVHHVLLTEPKASPTAAIPQETEGDQDTYKEGIRSDVYKY
jgi:hypothetical protein